MVCVSCLMANADQSSANDSNSSLAKALISACSPTTNPQPRLYGTLMGDRKELGRPSSIPDGQIAAIARRDRLAVATRNVLDFESCGIEVVNPFEFRL